MKNYYEILGLTKKSTLPPEEIKSAYDIAIANSEPDSNHHGNIQEAYEILIDPKKRAKYNSDLQEFIVREQETLLQKDMFGRNQLHQAIFNQDLNTVMYLVKKAKALNVFDQIIYRAHGDNPKHRHALIEAIFTQSLQIIGYLASEMNINTQNSYGNTALIFAVRESKISTGTIATMFPIIEQLTELGADINIANENGETAFSIAIDNKSKTVINILVLASQKQDKLDELIENYLIDKQIRPIQIEIAAKLTKNPEEYLQTRALNKLINLSTFLDHPEILLPVIDRLKQKGVLKHEDTQIKSERKEAEEVKVKLEPIEEGPFAKRARISRSESSEHGYK